MSVCKQVRVSFSQRFKKVHVCSIKHMHLYIYICVNMCVYLCVPGLLQPPSDPVFAEKGKGKWGKKLQMRFEVSGKRKMAAAFMSV